MLKSACYIRVSTDDQLEFSPEAQLKALKEYASKNNMYIDDSYIFKDEGISGKKAEKRPAFMEMIKTAKQKPRPFDVILVHKFDRFARNREDSVVYKSLLRKECGIKVISITEHIDDDKFSVILESMLEAMAEYYSLNLADEVKKGMTEKAIRGEYQTTAPLGYKKEKNKKSLTILDNEAKFIKYIFNEFLNGTPILTITKNVNSMGLRTHKGNPLENRTIKYILQNPVYKGYVRWTPTGKTGIKHENPDTIIKKSSHTPIISEDIYEKVQLKLKNKESSYSYKKRPPEEYKHWLSGLIKCSCCGATLVKATNSNFQCGNYSKGKCKVSHFLNISKAEKTVISEINHMLLFTENEYYKITSETDNNNETELLKNHIENTKKKLEKAKEAYLNEIDSLEEYKATKNKLTKEIENTEHKINLMFQKNKNSKNTDKILIKNLLQSNLSNLEKSLFIKTFISKLVYDKPNNCLIIYFKL